MNILRVAMPAVAMGFCAVACMSRVDLGSPGDAGMDVSSSPDASSGAGCSSLSACCGTLPSASQSSCVAVAAQGNASNCATELTQLVGQGYCATSPPGDAAGPPSDAGDASVQGNPDGQAQDAPEEPTTGTACPTTCTPPQVCIQLPGNSTGTCGPACQSNSDCPAWLTCQSGLCAQCSACAAGQQCLGVTLPQGTTCSSNAACGLGGYCQGGICAPFEVCIECLGGCQTCTSNAQCNAGQVCVGQACVTCTTNSQCGPTATCAATHAGVQCTCTQATDCASNETCQSGVCTGNISGCVLGRPGNDGCQNGQACINDECSPCSTFEDCNSGHLGTGQLSGSACIGGVCTACTANSQCGGGMACVGGTCGTCSTNAQCGTTGQCNNGYCTCTTSSDCASGQRCGAGICVSI